MFRIFCRLVCLLIALNCFVVPRPAEASPTWIDGPFQGATVVSCTSIIFRPTFYVVGMQSFVGTFINSNDPPEIGGVFYARIIVAAIGDICSSSFTVVPEFTLPSGVAAFPSPLNPIVCR